jgi:hypothetical protein
MCVMRELAVRAQTVDHVYAWLKNMLSPLGYVGFEAELYRFVEGLKR